MRRMKQVMSWLLVLVMMVSLVPANIARAEEEQTEEVTKYSVYVSPDVYMVDTWPSDEYINAFSVTVPDGQTGVEENVEDENYWYVEDGNTLTIQVTIPEDCMKDCLELRNWSETMTDVTFTQVEGQDNAYSIVVKPEEDMYLDIYDGTYFSVNVDPVTTNFQCYIAADTNATGEDAISYVKKGNSYVICLDTTLESITDETLSIMVNDTSIGAADLKKRDAGWYYEVTGVTKTQKIKIYETGTYFYVRMPDVSAYGYAIYDENGENKIGGDEVGWSYQVEANGSLSFKMIQEGTATDSTLFGLYVNDEELVPVDGIYTVSNVTWTTNVEAISKYTISVDEESSVKIIPCTETGDALEDDGVSGYAYRNNAIAYFKLDTDNYRDYVVTYDSGEIDADENGIYSYNVCGENVELTITEYSKCTVSITGADIKMIPCEGDGQELVDEAVTEYQYRSNETAYFKLDMDGQRYRVFNEDCELFADDNGVYSIEVGESDMEITVNLLYEVLYKDGPGYCIYMGSETESYDAGDMVDDYNCAYVPSGFFFSVGVPEDWNADDMVVALKDAEGNSTTLDPDNGPYMNEYEEMQYDFTATTTENVTVVVTGIYEECESNLVLSFDNEKFAGITMKLLDEEDEEVSWMDDWDGENEKAAEIYVGKTYSLVLSGEEETLKKIRMKSDGEELTGDIANGKLTVDVTNRTSISMAMDGEYYVSYDGSEDDTSSLIIYEYRADDLEEMWDVSGFYPGTLSFWIDSCDSNVSAENAYVVSVTDSTGAAITPKTTADVVVDNVGTKRIVYTVEFTSDITIQCAGGKYYEYDVNLPIPATDDYTISALYYTEDAYDDAIDEWYEKTVEYDGVANSTTGYTTFTNVTAGNCVFFDVTTDASNGTPYVKRTSIRGGETSITQLATHGEPTELDNGQLKYTYAFYVNGLTNIKVSVETAEIEVVAEGYYPVYNEDAGLWYIYNADPEEDDADPVLKIYDLPKTIDASDTEQKYYISYYICDDGLMVDDKNYDKLFTLQGEGKDDLPLSLIVDKESDYYRCYETPLQDGYTTLLVDMSLLEEENGKISLKSSRDDVKIAIAGEEGKDYIALENQEFAYKVRNQTLTFTLSAEGDAFPDDLFINFGYYDAEDAEMSEDEVSDGRVTRTYTLKDVTYNNTISVSYVATVELEESDYGWLTPEYLGQDPVWGEDGIVRYGKYGSGDGCNFVLGVDEGYDVDSVRVIQKYLDSEGNEQTTTYTQLLPYHTDEARICLVVMQAGVNTFSITEPKKLTYTMSMPTSAAYTIEYVNGSTTTVDYNDSFSFKLKANTGYDLSSVIVTANDKKMTPDANGVYTVTNVKENYTIAVTGFETNKYVVTFKDYDGKVLKTQTVDYGKDATAPAEPARTGYTFTGWDATFTKVTKDITVTATYKQVLVTKLTVTGDSKSLAVNKTMKLTASALPANALNSDVVWTTSNSKWATVSATGTVKALKKGAGKTVTITATAKDGSGVKATYKIKIYKNAVKKIKLSAKSKTVKAGKKVKITAKLTPSKSVCKTLVWTSSNTKWATVNAKGVVTTKKAGKGKTVKITAKATDGSNKKATIKIKIKK